MIDDRQLRRDRIHSRVKLKNVATELLDALEKNLQRHAVYADLLARLRDLCLRLVELVELDAQHLKLLAIRYRSQIGSPG